MANHYQAEENDYQDYVSIVGLGKWGKQMLKALDLFCGLGGWSDGLHAEGFQVIGVEIEPKIAMRYKHPCMLADVRKLNGKGFLDFDLIVGSPPCRDFCYFAENYSWKWKTPRNLENGLSMVNAFLRIIKEAKPKFWLMENVPQLAKYITLKEKVVKSPIAYKMKRSFWGNFPRFLIPQDQTKKRPMLESGNLKSWKRAKIPLPVSKALGRAIIQALDV